LKMLPVKLSHRRKRVIPVKKCDLVGCETYVACDGHRGGAECGPSLRLSGCIPSSKRQLPLPALQAGHEDLRGE
jgi:hypothetical protein